VTLFRDLEGKFQQGAVEQPVSFYFTLGNEPEAKWYCVAEPQRVSIVNGKPPSGTADCVLKTNQELFTRIVREAYIPGMDEFMSGAIKSNDVSLLATFQKVFNLSNAG
jgi:long-chain acyl-CoA synthetase